MDLGEWWRHFFYNDENFFALVGVGISLFTTFPGLILYWMALRKPFGEEGPRGLGKFVLAQLVILFLGFFWIRYEREHQIITSLLHTTLTPLALFNLLYYVPLFFIGVWVAWNNLYGLRRR